VDDHWYCIEIALISLHPHLRINRNRLRNGVVRQNISHLRINRNRLCDGVVRRVVHHNRAGPVRKGLSQGVAQIREITDFDLFVQLLFVLCHGSCTDWRDHECRPVAVICVTVICYVDLFIHIGEFTNADLLFVGEFTNGDLLLVTDWRVHECRPVCTVVICLTFVVVSITVVLSVMFSDTKLKTRLILSDVFRYYILIRRPNFHNFTLRINPIGKTDNVLVFSLRHSLQEACPCNSGCSTRRPCGVICMYHL
jgi:hypothetical protein